MRKSAGHARSMHSSVQRSHRAVRITALPFSRSAFPLPQSPTLVVVTLSSPTYSPSSPFTPPSSPGNPLLLPDPSSLPPPEPCPSPPPLQIRHFLHLPQIRHSHPTMGGGGEIPGKSPPYLGFSWGKTGQGNPKDFPGIYLGIPHISRVYLGKTYREISLGIPPKLGFPGKTYPQYQGFPGVFTPPPIVGPSPSPSPPSPPSFPSW